VGKSSQGFLHEDFNQRRNTMQTNLSLTELYQFSGSEQFFKHGINRKFIYTDGVQYLAKKARCYWLIDDIALVLLP
jgi:hypothetical protein